MCVWDAASLTMLVWDSVNRCSAQAAMPRTAGLGSSVDLEHVTRWVTCSWAALTHHKPSLTGPVVDFMLCLATLALLPPPGLSRAPT